MNANIIKFKNQEDVVCASKLVLNEGLRPCRIVLRDLGDQYVTHVESMHIAVDTREEAGYVTDYVVCTHEGYDHGHYFSYRNETKGEAYEKALVDFNERAAKL